MADFQGFPKIARLSRDIVITEKIDGTNAQIYIPEDDSGVFAGSRTRMITLDSDNFGFAKWVYDHAEELRVGLGYGRHFGEWWGAGIQRGYGLDHKRFSLFNTARWADTHIYNDLPLGKRSFAPECCYVVPILHVGNFNTIDIKDTLDLLQLRGSQAAPKFMYPEGIVIWHDAAQQLFKKTIEKDAQPKGANANT